MTKLTLVVVLLSLFLNITSWAQQTYTITITSVNGRDVSTQSASLVNLEEIGGTKGYSDHLDITATISPAAPSGGVVIPVTMASSYFNPVIQGVPSDRFRLISGDTSTDGFFIPEEKSSEKSPIGVVIDDDIIQRESESFTLTFGVPSGNYSLANGSSFILNVYLYNGSDKIKQRYCHN